MDLAISTAIHRPFTWWLNIVFVLQTISFVLLLYVLSVSANKAAMSAYRWCLLTNIVSVYGFQCMIFLCKPILIPKGVYLASYGLADNLFPKGLMACLFCAIFFVMAHIVAMQFCIYYQYARLVASDVLSRIYGSRQRFFAFYFSITVVTCIMFAVPFGTCEFQFDAKDVIQYDIPVRPIFLDNAENLMRLHMGSLAKLVVTFVFFSLATTFTVLMAYCCIKTYTIVYRNDNYRSDRTNRMQLTLFKSLVAQTVCLVVCYALPLSIIIYMYFYASAYVYSTIVFLHYVMYLYAPLNYAMIFVFATQFRTELLQLIGWKKRGRRNSRTKPYTGIHFVSMTN